MHSSESWTEAPDLVAGLWRPLYVEWSNYAINYVKRPVALFHSLDQNVSFLIPAENRKTAPNLPMI
jgi:hypothetical protein